MEVVWRNWWRCRCSCRTDLSRRGRRSSGTRWWWWWRVIERNRQKPSMQKVGESGESRIKINKHDHTSKQLLLHTCILKMSTTILHAYPERSFQGGEPNFISFYYPCPSQIYLGRSVCEMSITELDFYSASSNLAEKETGKQLNRPVREPFCIEWP